MNAQRPPEMVCGNCRKYEPSRTDAKYGFCGPRERLEQEKRHRAAGRLVDVTTPCFMAAWNGKENKPAFESRP